MRASIVKPLLALALLALLPEAAPALELNGWIGGDYYRRDDLTEHHLLDDRLHLDVGIYAAGSIVDPGVVDWRLDGSYARNRSNYASSTVNQGILTYSGQLRLLDTPASRLSVTASAARTQSDVTTNSTASGGLTGNSVADTYQASLVLRFPERPTLILGGTLWDTTNSGFGRPDNTLRTKVGDVTLLHGGSGYNYGAFYEIRDQVGTNAAANFRTQRIDVNSQVVLSTTAQAGMAAQQYVRTPMNDSSLNLSMDDTRVRLYGNFGDPDANLRAQYNFGHTQTRGMVGGDQQTFAHNASVTGLQVLSPEWSLRPTASLASTQVEQGAVEQSAAGQTVGVDALWLRSGDGQTIGGILGARLALLEPNQGSTQVGAGGTGGLSYGAEAWGLQYLGSYRLDYDTNVDAVEGNDLRQQANLDATSSWARNATTRASLVYTANRRHRTVLGDAADRTFLLRATTVYREYTLALELSSSDGVTGALGNPIRVDGFFLPADYQTSSRFGLVSITAPFGERLSLFGSVKYGTLKAPEFATQGEWTFQAALNYRIGQFAFSIEDQLATGGSTSLDYSVNTLFLRVVRNFGSR